MGFTNLNYRSGLTLMFFRDSEGHACLFIFMQAAPPAKSGNYCFKRGN